MEILWPSVKKFLIASARDVTYSSCELGWCDLMNPSRQNEVFRYTYQGEGGGYLFKYYKQINKKEI